MGTKRRERKKSNADHSQHVPPPPSSQKPTSEDQHHPDFAGTLIQLILKKRRYSLLRFSAFLFMSCLLYFSYIIYNWPLLKNQEKYLALLAFICAILLIGACILDMSGHAMVIQIGLKLLDLALEGQNRWKWASNTWSCIMMVEILLRIPALWVFSSFLNVLQLWACLGLTGEKQLVGEPIVALLFYIFVPNWILALVANSILYALLVMWVELESEKKFWDLGAVTWITLVLFDIYWRKILSTSVWTYCASYCICFGATMAWSVFRHRFLVDFLENRSKLNFLIIYLPFHSFIWCKENKTFLYSLPWKLQHFLQNSINTLLQKMKRSRN